MATKDQTSKFIEARSKAKNELTDLVMLAQDPKTSKKEIFDKSHSVLDSISDMVMARFETPPKLIP